MPAKTTAIYYFVIVVCMYFNWATIAKKEEAKSISNIMIVWLTLHTASKLICVALQSEAHEDDYTGVGCFGEYV